MIKIKTETYRIDSCNFKTIQDRMVENTCKTNLSPQLLFKQNYQEHTLKTFVGNWKKDGFWLTKYRKQFAQLRPNIISRFKFIESEANGRIVITYSIGFSSIFYALMLITMFASIFTVFGLLGFTIGFILLTVGYAFLASAELDFIRFSLEEKLLIGVGKVLET